MDEQWLREWVAEECEYPPKNLREEVGELLAELDSLRVRVTKPNDDIPPGTPEWAAWQHALAELKANLARQARQFRAKS